MKRVVHGDDLLYRFFQDVLTREPELFALVPHLMVRTMGVWLPVDVYRELPILLPWVVRDPTCRGRKSKSGEVLKEDEWSAPARDTGLLRDDNSLVKALPRSLVIHAPKSPNLNGAHLGTEFVASHIWRVVTGTTLASRLPLLNSFVPNLVWLPSQVSKLSDREGSVVQEALKSTSWAIYRHAPVADGLQLVADEAWALLPTPAPATESLVIGELNWFVATLGFLETRRRRIDEVLRALDDLSNGLPLTKKVVTTRYTEGLPRLDGQVVQNLRTHMQRFASTAL